MAGNRKRIAPQTIPEIARRMRLLRRTTGLSQYDFAEQLGIARNVWSNVEGKFGRIGVDTAMKLCDQYGVTLDWIYRGDEQGLSSDLRKRLQELETEAPLTERAEDTLSNIEPAFPIEPSQEDAGRSSELLTIAEAKQRLAHSFGVDPSSIKIIIEA